MPEMHSRQPVFTYSACGPFTKNKKRIQKHKSRKFKIYLSKRHDYLFKAATFSALLTFT